MRHYLRKDRLRWKHDKGVAVYGGYVSRAIGAFLGRGLKLRITAGKLSALRHAHHAMMLSIATAARRQVRLALAGHGQQRLDERQAQQGQQRDGEKFPQC